MNEKQTGIEFKIILAAIECIEKYGISGATNRQIARVAGVNNAAINYYFRSKEVLIQRCMEITLKNTFDLNGMPLMSAASAEERCVAVLMNLMTGGYQRPGTMHAHFFNLLVQGQPDILLAEYINRFINDLAEDLQERGCALAQNELKVSLTQMVSAVILAVLAPTLFEQHQGFNLQNPNTCRAYVTRLVKKLLA